MTCGRLRYLLSHCVLAVVIFHALVVDASHRSSTECRNRICFWNYSSTQPEIQLPTEGTIISNLIRFTSHILLHLDVVPFLSKRAPQVGPCMKGIWISFWEGAVISQTSCYLSISPSVHCVNHKLLIKFRPHRTSSGAGKYWQWLAGRWTRQVWWLTTSSNISQPRSYDYHRVDCPNSDFNFEYNSKF